MFGFADLSKIALKLETVIKKHQIDSINQQAQELLNEIDQVLW